MAIDLDHELKRAIDFAASLYGPPAQTFRLEPVSYHQKNYAQSIVDEHNRTISVRLADPTPFADKDGEATYELWHEAVHCLVPVSRMDTLWFEEGVALRFGLKHAPVASHMKKKYREALKPPWKLVNNAFNRLNATDGQIRMIRERADRGLFDTVTKELIIENCDAKPALAEQLCQRLPAYTR